MELECYGYLPNLIESLIGRARRIRIDSDCRLRCSHQTE